MSEETKVEDVVVECTKDGEVCKGEDAETCPFKCDGECPAINPVEPPAEEGPPVDPTAEFDWTREDRKKMLTGVNEVLKKLAAGQKLSAKKSIDMVKKLAAHALLLDELVVTLLQEMYRIVQAVANQEVSDFSLRASMDALASALIDKGLVTKSELQDSFNKIIKQSFPAPEAVEPGEKDDVEDAEIVAEYVAPVEAEVKPEEG